MTILRIAKPLTAPLSVADTQTLPLSGDCPAWCADHYADDCVRLHERIVLDLVADDAAWTNAAATVQVYVEALDDLEPDGRDVPPRVVVTLAHGAEPGLCGQQDTQAWTGTPAQVRTLGYALIRAAALIVDGGR